MRCISHKRFCESDSLKGHQQCCMVTFFFVVAKPSPLGFRPPKSGRSLRQIHRSLIFDCWLHGEYFGGAAGRRWLCAKSYSGLGLRASAGGTRLSSWYRKRCLALWLGCARHRRRRGERTHHATALWLISPVLSGPTTACVWSAEKPGDRGGIKFCWCIAQLHWLHSSQFPKSTLISHFTEVGRAGVRRGRQCSHFFRTNLRHYP